MLFDNKNQLGHNHFMALRIEEFCEYLKQTQQRGGEITAFDTDRGNEYAAGVCKIGGALVQIRSLAKLCINCTGCPGPEGLAKAFTKKIAPATFAKARTALEMLATAEKL